MEERVFGGDHQSGRATRSTWEAIKRGAMGKCPHCGEGRLFASFLKTVDRCEVCGEEMHHHRADDLPAYLVLVVVGHIVVGAAMSVESSTNLSLLQHMMMWVPASIIGSLLLLRPVKGAVVGFQWALYMHGFGGETDAIETHPEL